MKKLQLRLNHHGFAHTELILSVLVIGVIIAVGTFIITNSHAQAPSSPSNSAITSNSHKKNKTPQPIACTFTADTLANNLTATGGGLQNSSNYTYQIYASDGTANIGSVGGGELTTDSTGTFTWTSGSQENLKWFMSVYPSEKTLTFSVYPIVGQKTDLNTVVSTCTVTP
ncbi:MAG TPA: hypothetical protein VLF79_02870 [Candidatus Saccharimonadales bacterium]|nr:hypothetical protein [Candidatus Saccharimonadales bacterium]